jgi:hypothetical protein
MEAPHHLHQKQAMFLAIILIRGQTEYILTIEKIYNKERRQTWMVLTNQF